jgi:hypothetical protein
MTVIALLILLWLFACVAIVALCRAAAHGDAVNAKRREARTGTRLSPRSGSRTPD